MGNEYKIAECKETCRALIDDEYAYESSASTNYIFSGRISIFSGYVNLNYSR